MKFKEQLAAIGVVDELASTTEEDLLREVDDFETGNYRMIRKDAIDKILEDELASDEYVLGCFRAEFIAEQTNLPFQMIEACQKAEAFTALGKGILKTCGIKPFAKAYQEADGYGHHFAQYDGETLEIEDYYVFKIN